MQILSPRHGPGWREGAGDGLFLAGVLLLLVAAVVLSLAVPWG